jgi:hypothetical protein
MITFNHPYHKLNGGKWVKGNLHAHTAKSDGILDPQELIDEYARRGYGFLMIADHDTLTSEQELLGYDSRGMILIPGNEFGETGPHVLHINAKFLLAASSSHQAILDTINSEGGIAVISHPNWYKFFNHCPQEYLEDWQGYTGIEIFNGVTRGLAGNAYACDRWDMLLPLGRRIWGFANDDTHEEADIGLGWNVVYGKDLSVEALVGALKRGSFYASSGVVIDTITVEANCIMVETENAEKIVAIADYGYRLKEVEGRTMHLEFDGTVPHPDKFQACCHQDGRVRYIRFECLGKPEQLAWTQPFFVCYQT